MFTLTFFILSIIALLLSIAIDNVKITLNSFTEYFKDNKQIIFCFTLFGAFVDLFFIMAK